MRDAAPGVGPAGRAAQRLWGAVVRLGPVVSVTSLGLVIAAQIAGLPPRVQLLFLAICAGAIVTTYLDEVVLRIRVRRARKRESAAIDVERQRVERALAEGAQRRLMRIRAELSALGGQVGVASMRDEIRALTDDLDAAVNDIRSITLDEALGLLIQQGLPAALGAVAQIVPFNVSVKAKAFRRYPAMLERAMYFCCVEALQNVEKHGGPVATARIRLVERPGSVFFSVVDSGVGFDPAAAPLGIGMSNLADRVGYLGGQLRVQSKPGCGTCIRAEIPIPPDTP